MAWTMVGTQAPQKLFSDMPAAVSQMPGMVTPQITAAMPSMVDLEGILDAQNKQKAISAATWARAAAMNNARAAQSNAPQEHYLPSTASQTSGMGYQQPQGSVMWAPRNLSGAKLGTWTQQQQNKAIAENREMPVVLQAHANDPYSPGEVGGGLPNSVIGRGIYGPGISTALGGANPAVWQRMWADRQAGGNSTRSQLQPFNERKPYEQPFQYDMFGGR